MANELIQQLDNLANSINAQSGTTAGMTIEEMNTAVAENNSEIETQADLIAQIQNALVGKAIEDSNFEEVKYLIRSNSGYIDTGVSSDNSKLSFVMRYSFSVLPNGYWYLLRGYAAESKATTRILFSGTSSTFFQINSLASSSGTLSLNRKVNTVYTEILGNSSDTMFAYSSNFASSTKARSTAEANGETIKLFHIGVDDGVIMNLYFLKIYDNEQIIRDFIPCYNGEEYGLYDKISKNFYTNVGQGSFGGVHYD